MQWQVTRNSAGTAAPAVNPFARGYFMDLNPGNTYTGAEEQGAVSKWLAGADDWELVGIAAAAAVAIVATGGTVAALGGAKLTARGVLAYTGWQAGFAAAETGIEYGLSRAMGDDQWAGFGTTFGKNFAINFATGGIGGKGKMAHRLGAWAFGQSIEIAADTTFDVGVRGQDWQSSLVVNAVGSVGGDLGLRTLGHGFRASLPRFSSIAASRADYSIVTRGDPYELRFFSEAEVIAEMETSEIGRLVVREARKNTFRLEFSGSYHKVGLMLREDPRILGAAFKKKAKIYVPAHRLGGDITETAIHEGVHMLGVRGSRRAEVLARLATLIHRGETIDRSVLKRVVREVRGYAVYSRLRWKLNKTSPFIPDTVF